MDVGVAAGGGSEGADKLATATAARGDRAQAGVQDPASVDGQSVTNVADGVTFERSDPLPLGRAGRQDLQAAGAAAVEH